MGDGETVRILAERESDGTESDFRFPPRRARKAPILLAVAIAASIGLVAYANSQANRAAPSAGNDVVQSFGASCVASAAQAIRRNGRDPDAPAVKKSVGIYCGCMLMQLQAQYPAPEFAAIALRNGESLAKDEKLNAIVKQCMRAAGGA